MFLSTARAPSCWPSGQLSYRAFQQRWASNSRINKARDRFSVLADHGVSKQSVLNCIASRDEAPYGSPTPNASAILVSKDLSRWLDDTDFMSALLQLLHPEAGSSDQDLSILTAAVDGLCPRSHGGSPSSGLSILQGDAATILPGLWDREAPAASLRQHSDGARPAVSMRLSPLLGDFRPVDVTLPLANTVFQNARPFTLLASRWRVGGAGTSPTGAMALVDAFEKETQGIAASTEGSIQSHADVSTPLFPLTAPRRITAGLGNIVRQVEAADGPEEEPQPASEELEASMHAIIATRSRLLPGVPVPNRTWALVVPRNSPSLDFLVKLPLSLDSSIESEHGRADAFARHFSKVLADGGRLHRVLSGGGGWGAKRGLLSLDPETTYSSSGAQDLESFIASFGGEVTADSVVTPGSYIQFLVEPMPLSSTGSANEAAQNLPPLVLGTTPAQIAGDEKTEHASSSTQLVAGHFGALSSSGIFLSLESGAGSEAARGSRPPTTLTKVDVPNAYVWQGTSRWI
ncbi:hypothetical protein RB595_005824 [Gaeumannomyces hyphopodioides]